MTISEMNNKSGNLVIVNSCDYKLCKTFIANFTWKNCPSQSSGVISLKGSCCRETTCAFLAAKT